MDGLRARIFFLVLTALLASLFCAGCGNDVSSSTRTEAAATDTTESSLGVESAPQDAPATWLEDLGCRADTTPTVVVIGDPAVRAPLDAGIRDATAAVLLDDAWKAGDTTLDRAALARQLELSADTVYACDTGRLYVYAPLSKHPDEVCPVDLTGFFSTSDGSVWTADHVDCAGDIGPICRHTPKQLRSVWHPGTDPMHAACEWRTSDGEVGAFVGG